MIDKYSINETHIILTYLTLPHLTSSPYLTSPQPTSPCLSSSHLSLPLLIHFTHLTSPLTSHLSTPLLIPHLLASSHRAPPHLTSPHLSSPNPTASFLKNKKSIIYLHRCRLDQLLKKSHKTTIYINIQIQKRKKGEQRKMSALNIKNNCFAIMFVANVAVMMMVMMLMLFYCC